MHHKAVFTARKRAANTPRKLFMGGLIAHQLHAHQREAHGATRAATEIPAGAARRPALWRRFTVLSVAGALLVTVLAGCSTLGFYQQAVSGQIRLLNARQSVDKLLADTELPSELRSALRDSQATLEFARSHLRIPADGRYTDYVALDHPYVVWNLVVAPRDSVVPETWCFPIAGCVSYRGYFNEQRARRNAAQFDPDLFDTYVGGVAAYSTLGWFDDPLLSSFVHWPRPARAELLFHELAHGVLYVAGDTAFNESFATFVAQQALPEFLRQIPANSDLALETSALDSPTPHTPAAQDTSASVPAAASAELRRHERARLERARFNAFLLSLRDRLADDFAALQEQDMASAAERARRVEAIRQRRHQEAQACFAQVAGEFENQRFGRYFEQPLNLARLSLVGAYHGWVGAFAQLFRQEHEDIERFYTAAKRLAALESAPREEALQRLQDAWATSKQQIESDSDHQHADEIHCEAFADHVVDGNVAG